MDLFSLIFSLLDVYLLKIEKLYTYIFRFFLPDTPDSDDGSGAPEPTKQNKVHI